MALETTIEISWSSRKLEKLCASDRRGQRKWGADHWRILKRRLLMLEAAPTLSDLENAPGRVHQLRADRRNQFALSLWGSFRLVFVAHDPVPQRPDGSIDRSAVSEINIVEIVDYHGH